MEWFSTLSLALGSAWTSGINLYATVVVLGLVQRIGGVHLPGGLDVLDSWLIIGIAAALYAIEFVADKVPYFDSLWDVLHTFIRIPAGAIIAYSATDDLNSAYTVIATLLGGGLALSSHGTKAAVRAGINLSPEPVSNWVMSLIEDVVAFLGAFLAVVAPAVIAIVLGAFILFFIWFAPKVMRAFRRTASALRALFAGEGLKAVAEKAP
jgi:hypothetical protein